ncbi:glycosyl hydrolase [Parabacteroides sp. TM07-1AC]|nr:glycosyl hydrolase [Parabacteroides sp. TM07-1AC]
MKLIKYIACSLLMLPTFAQAQQSDPVEDALSRLTLEEKVALTHAQSKFCSPGVARLGIPEFWMTDGPHGIRPEVLWDEWEQAGWTNDSCVAFPALTCLAATWNPKIALLYGKSIGEEARYRNKTVLLGPGVNIYRSPLNGRNFEYMGEDPYLAGKMVVPYVQGVQQNGVAACVKHYALNNQEVNRHTTNVIVDDRALYEIYLPAFKAAVQEGKAWAIMGSYNLYKDQHGCHNQYLLNDILKGEWGFDGVVISDWGGVYNTQQAITNGLDMEFGSWTNGLSNGASNAYDNYYLADPYLQLIREGKVGTKELDDKVRRILRLAYRTNMDRNRPYGSLCSDAHFAAARQIGEEGIVLLQNKNNVLPIDLNRAKKIAVIGENAVKMMTVGGGSSSLKVKYELSPLDGIRRRVGDKAEVVYARGYVGDPSGEYNGVKSGQDLEDSRSPEELIAEAVAVAREADYVIFIGGLNKSAHQDCEDADRKELGLSYGQDQVIAALAQANKNLIMVNISGNAIAMPWVKEVPAIVQAWYLGSEAGNAIASVLLGDVNPSGKLPFTFPVSLQDVGAHQLGEYPGTPRNDGSNLVDEKYNESIFVGYRWADKQKTRPLFSFGHGLSYTTFEYGKVTADKKAIVKDEPITFTLTVKNTGDREGAEVVQLYISDKKSSLPRPIKELKGFQKVYLQPGEVKQVSFTIGTDALSFFDDGKHEWIAEPGQFETLVGASSTDIRGKVVFELK